VPNGKSVVASPGLFDLDAALAEALDHRRHDGLLRRRRTVKPIDAVHVKIDSRVLVNFASNDYLGLTHHPRVLAALRSAGAAGSGAAGLITGHTDAHARAEAAIAAWKNAEAAVLLPSGYQANLAAVQTIAAVAGNNRGTRARFLIDKLAHASLIDAVRQTGMPMRVFPHNGIAKLARLLESSEPGTANIVVTESIFSMDGDAADLPSLAELRRRFGFILMLDEAHASGVYGPRGSGYAAEIGLNDIADISVVTLSKGIGLAGGAIVGSQRLCDVVVNFGRAYIYSTAIAPALATAVVTALDVLRDEPQRQQRLRALSTRVRSRLASSGWAIPRGDSPIIPVVLGTEKAALDAADTLEAQDLLCVAVRPPTVRAGSSRLRITLSCEHTDEQIERLLAALDALRRDSK
jgi:8-amino-7-oxononanoate synthase